MFICYPGMCRVRMAETDRYERNGTLPQQSAVFIVGKSDVMVYIFNFAGVTGDPFKAVSLKSQRSIFMPVCRSV